MIKYFSKGRLYPGLFHVIFEVSRVSLRKWDNLGVISIFQVILSPHISFLDPLSSLEVTFITNPLSERVTLSVNSPSPKKGHKTRRNCQACRFFFVLVIFCLLNGLGTRKLITMNKRTSKFWGSPFFFVCSPFFSPKRIMVEIANPKFHDPTDCICYIIRGSL